MYKLLRSRVIVVIVTENLSNRTLEAILDPLDVNSWRTATGLEPTSTTEILLPPTYYYGHYYHLRIIADITAYVLWQIFHNMHNDAHNLSNMSNDAHNKLI